MRLRPRGLRRVARRAREWRRAVAAPRGFHGCRCLAWPPACAPVCSGVVGLSQLAGEAVAAFTIIAAARHPPGAPPRRHCGTASFRSQTSALAG